MHGMRNPLFKMQRYIDVDNMAMDNPTKPEMNPPIESQLQDLKTSASQRNVEELRYSMAFSSAMPNLVFMGSRTYPKNN
jgi:hypothetical protein